MNKKFLKNMMFAIGAIAIVLVITAVGFFSRNRGWYDRSNSPLMIGKSFVNQFNKNGAMSYEEVEKAIELYIADYRDTDLHLGEIMIFNNHAYAQVVEEESGIGAFELLVDPSTLSVYPEQGPNMMWNEKYGHMRGESMMGGGYSAEGNDMPISGNEAVRIADEYLEDRARGLTADDHADPFYGYYTIHTIKNGEVYGMLSVNAYSGQVIIHSWHGDFIEMSDYVYA